MRRGCGGGDGGEGDGGAGGDLGGGMRVSLLSALFSSCLLRSGSVVAAAGTGSGNKEKKGRPKKKETKKLHSHTE